MSFLSLISKTNSLAGQQHLLPIRLHSASAGEFASLRYPAGVAAGGLPATRGGFANLLGKCSATMGECGRC